jgi:ADP-heptose:LPS heptosyltransferase
MFEDTRHSLGLRLARWKLRKLGNEMIPFTSAVSSAKRALAIMPLGPHDSGPTLSVVQLLKARFLPENITVIVGDTGGEVSRMLPRSKVVHLIRPQVDYFYLPRPDFLGSLDRKPYDLAIDLNLDFILPSAYICRVSGAAVRIGFNHTHADVFYNFQIKPDPSLGRKQIYERLVHCLESF